ncbi:MAG: DUF427 domain-containing protein [Pseudolabrys sp.]|jgi:uncharacterized protein (DUF427 family)
MKIPGPDHPISVSRNVNRVRVTFGGKVIADTTRALTLQEASYPPVQYIPRADVDMTQLKRTLHSTHCPYKGDASYFTIGGSSKGENAVWSYETPYSAVAQIAEHVAFYPNRVDAIEELKTQP